MEANPRGQAFCITVGYWDESQNTKNPPVTETNFRSCENDVFSEYKQMAFGRPMLSIYSLYYLDTIFKIWKVKQYAISN